MTRLAPKPKRKEFTPKTRALARERSQGLCEVYRVPRCMYPALPEKCARKATDYDHITPATFGGDNSISNLAFLCETCHKIKTCTDNKEAKKSNALRGETGNGPKAKIQSRGFRGHRKFNGERVWK